MTKVAVAYVRRSKESGERTVSLDDQTARVRAYVEAQGWQLGELIVDDGISGGKRGRFDRIRAAVAAHKAQAVVVYHLDRFARDVAGLLDELRGFVRRGVELHVVGRGRIETETATGFLTTSIEGVLAEHYRRVVGEKTRDALAHLRTSGRRYTNVLPFGWRLAENGVDLVPEPAEQSALAVARELRASGASLWKVSAALAERGFVATSGRPFDAKTVSRFLADRPIGQSRTLSAAA